MPRRITLAMLASLLVLGGCSALSPYSKLTKLDLELHGSDRLNPDLNGRPSPIVLRLLELRHPVAFENGDFFALYQRPKEALAPDPVTSEELELRPGESRELKLSCRTAAATSACWPPTATCRKPAGATSSPCRRKSAPASP